MASKILLIGVLCLFLFGIHVDARNTITPDLIVIRSLESTKIGINFNNIRLLNCVSPNKKIYTGTAFFVEGGKLITAAHVVNNRICFDMGGLGMVKIIQTQNDLDFAIGELPNSPKQDLPNIDCNGFQTMDFYDAIGFAGGTRLMLNRVMATRHFTPNRDTTEGVSSGHLRILKGDIFHGMSGGPIFDRNGRVVGINNVTYGNGWGSSRSLSDTILCKSSR